MADVNLSKGVRTNLLALQGTASQMAKTQNRLATGLKVNSALDNPSNFFTASALNSRAGDMAALLDSMSNGIKTIEAADNGLKSITKTVESMQSTLRQARQDKSWKYDSFAVDATSIGGGPNGAAKFISFTGGALGNTTQQVQLNSLAAAVPATSGTWRSNTNFAAGLNLANATDSFSFDITVDGNTTNVTITRGDLLGVGNNDGILDSPAELQTLLTNKGVNGVTVGGAVGQPLTFTSASQGPASQVLVANVRGSSAAIQTAVGTNLGLNNGVATQGTAFVPAGGAKSVDQLAQEINNNTLLKGKVRAANDNGKLRIENQSTETMTLTGIGADGELDGTTGTREIDGNTVRRNLVKQFNELRDQLDKFADDASFNGINLLRGDKLKLTFNETGTSSIEVQAKNDSGVPIAINNAMLKIEEVQYPEFNTDSMIDDRLSVMSNALNSLRAQASAFGSNLSVVENRTDFSKRMINTLETGASNLTLADSNEEAANLLALQTRQSLSSTALSMASQADQAVLRLFQ